MVKITEFWICIRDTKFHCLLHIKSRWDSSIARFACWFEQYAFPKTFIKIKFQFLLLHCMCASLDVDVFIITATKKNGIYWKELLLAGLSTPQSLNGILSDFVQHNTVIIFNYGRYYNGNGGLTMTRLSTFPKDSLTYITLRFGCTLPKE